MRCPQLYTSAPVRRLHKGDRGEKDIDNEVLKRDDTMPQSPPQLVMTKVGDTEEDPGNGNGRDIMEKLTLSDEMMIEPSIGQPRNKDTGKTIQVHVP